MQTTSIANRKCAFKDESFWMVKYLVLSEKYYIDCLISFWCPSGNSHLIILHPWHLLSSVNGFSPESCQIFFGVTACLSQVRSEPYFSLLQCALYVRCFAFLRRDTSFSVVLWLFFLFVFSVSVQVKNYSLVVFLVVRLCHPFFSLTFMLIWYLKVIGNTLASLVNGVLWITDILPAVGSWVHRTKRLFYLPFRFHLKTEVRCGLWLLFMAGIASWASIRSVLIWLCLSRRG